MNAEASGLAAQIDPGDTSSWVQALSEELGRVPPRPRSEELLHRLRQHPERWLHPWRRRNALHRLARRRGLSSFLFVCIGNLYRSPFAAAAFQATLPGPFRQAVRCASAGLTAADLAAPPDAVAAAARRRIDLSAHRSRLLSAEDVRTAHLVVVMDADQQHLIHARFGRARSDVLVLGDLDPEPIQARGIPDPWEQPPEVLDASYARLLRCVRQLAQGVMGIGGTTHA